MKEIKIQDVRAMCDRGAFRAFVLGGGVYLEDTATREKVRLDNLPVASGKNGSRVERMFGSRENWPNRKQGKTTKDDPKPDNGVDEGQGPYRGFLLIQCEECGETKAFCAKRETYSYKCGCGHVTPLENLLPAHMDCKCGKKSRYKTNASASIVSANCVECGAPVDLERNRRGTAFVTIRGDGA